MESDLFGPDVSETAPEVEAEPVAVEVGDHFKIRTWQYVNRWVFLKHQRAAALAELRQLVEDARADARRNP